MTSITIPANMVTQLSDKDSFTIVDYDYAKSIWYNNNYKEIIKEFTDLCISFKTMHKQLNKNQLIHFFYGRDYNYFGAKITVDCIYNDCPIPSINELINSKHFQDFITTYHPKQKEIKHALYPAQ